MAFFIPFPPARSKVATLAIACALLATPRSAQAGGKAVEAATEMERKEAGELYTAAMTDFESDRYEPALEGFRRSYDIVRSPNSHFMIARSLARLGRNIEAWDELDAVIAEARALGERYGDTVTAAYAKQDEIRPRLGLLTVTTRDLPKDTRVTVGGERLAPEKLGHAVAVLPGDTVVAFVARDGRQDSRKVHLDGGKSASIELAPGPAPSGKEEPSLPYVERARHERYRVEIEAHLALEVLNPPGRATRGVGPGGRLSVEVLPTGLVPGINDGLAVTAGADWIGTSTDPHVIIPAALQYDLWLTEGMSVLFEPGVAVLLGAGTRVSPDVAAGIRVRLWKNLHAVGRLGIPAASVGLSWLE